MDFQRAVKIIKRTSVGPGIEIEVLPNNEGVKRFFDDGSYKVLSPRETIRMARSFTTDRSEKYKKIVKDQSDRRNRAATRDKINKRDFDGIPQDGPVKTEDPWSWD